MAVHETSPSALKFDWQQKFEAVLFEADPQKLSELTADAEAAIFLRFLSLDTSPDGHVEQDALGDAIRTLRTIQTGSCTILTGTVNDIWPFEAPCEALARERGHTERTLRGAAPRACVSDFPLYCERFCGERGEIRLKVQ
jgi:hypothetical protein